jgi:3' terminal RNA ribose 2'-O-methyltransferase Hen1
VAISQAFGTALGGRSRERPELAAAPLPLEARLPVVPCRGGEELLRRLFEPLGYAVDARRLPLDPEFPEWGEGRYFALQLSATVRLQALLSHLYVLLPVLDDDKHYWVGDDEVDKLLRHGEAWLPEHPERNLIVDRYLRRQRRLTQAALARLIEDEAPEADEAAEQQAAEEEQVERPISLNEERLATVVAALKGLGARRVLDLGCAQGNLLRRLMAEKQFDEIVGLDVSHRALEISADRLRLDRLAHKQRARIQLLQGSLTYRDRRLEGYDAAAVVEVIEHFDPPRLAAFERALFGCARPQAVIVTTPNVEYNVHFESLPAGKLRHRDHRFEWTRAEFQAWATTAAARHGYRVRFAPIGPDDPVTGPPTQLGVFERE